MKRLRLGGEGVLMLLGRSSGDEGRSPTGRVFECKTCSRQFPSFQALGGHRASHKKPKGYGTGQDKPKVHECSICGLEFGIGQALGGHMRRHRGEGGGHEQGHGGEKKRVRLDLNLPPSEDERFGIENIVDNIHLGVCFH